MASMSSSSSSSRSRGSVWGITGFWLCVLFIKYWLWIYADGFFWGLWERVLLGVLVMWSFRLVALVLGFGGCWGCRWKKKGLGY